MDLIQDVLSVLTNYVSNRLNFTEFLIEDGPSCEIDVKFEPRFLSHRIDRPHISPFFGYIPNFNQQLANYRSTDDDVNAGTIHLGCRLYSSSGQMINLTFDAESIVVNLKTRTISHAPALDMAVVASQDIDDVTPLSNGLWMSICRRHKSVRCPVISLNKSPTERFVCEYCADIADVLSNRTSFSNNTNDSPELKDYSNLLSRLTSDGTLTVESWQDQAPAVFSEITAGEEDVSHPDYVVYAYPATDKSDEAFIESNVTEYMAMRYIADRDRQLTDQGLDRHISCDFCLFETPKASVMNKHRARHRLKFDICASVTCCHCNDWSGPKLHLNAHFATAHKSVAVINDQVYGICPECMTVVPKQGLYDHLKKNHIQTAHLKCSNCDRTFKSKYYLEVHMATQHTQSDEIKNIHPTSICDVCGRKFYHVKLLEKHYNTVHIYNQRGRVRCPFCSKILANPMVWHKHIKLHSSIKPFRCRECPYRSVKRFNVLLHARKRHNVSATYADVLKVGDFAYSLPAEDLQFSRYIVPND